MKKALIPVFLLVAILLALLFSDGFLKVCFGKKVWLHRVNNIEKLERANSSFVGVELDVVFDKTNNYFDIHHPPEPASGLSLETYLTTNGRSKEAKYWLDFKNLNDSNRSESLERLMRLVNSLAIEPSAIVIEAKDPCLLKLFENAGFLTSYYLPSGLSKLHGESLKTAVSVVQRELDLCPTVYVSSEFRDYEVLDKHFPKQEKLFWFTVYAGMNKLKARLILLQLLMDDSVDVLLIGD